MELQLILFDIDGMLVDTAGAGRRAIERAFVEVFAVDAVAAKPRVVRFAGLTDLTIFRALADAVGIDPRAYESGLGDLHAAYIRELRAEMAQPDPRRRLIPGVGALLQELASRSDAVLGLLTGNLEDGARIKLEPFGLNRHFRSGGFGSDSPDRREVARTAARKLSQLHGVDFAGERVAVIGDTEHDIDCAKANGFRSIAVSSGWVEKAVLLDAAPDLIVDDLAPTAELLDALGLDRGPVRRAE